MFEPDRLTAREPFATRLAAFLDEVRATLGLRAVAVAELDVVAGRVGAVWRAGSPAVTGGAPHEPQLTAWVLGPAIRPAGDPELRGIGSAFDDRPVAVLPLTLEPRFDASAPDAVALLALGERAPDAGVLAQVTRVLERGLSADRRERLLETVFAAVEQAPDAIELTDREARLVYANRAWEAFFGYRPTEVVGSTVGALFRDPVKPLHDPAFYQFTLTKLREGRPWLGALACRTASGSRVFCEVAVSGFDGGTQGFRGNVAIRRDVAHRAERDEALAIAHSEFRRVLASVPDGVVVLRDDRIYFANPAFIAMVRSDERRVVGRPFAEFVHPEDRRLVGDAHADGALVRVRMSTPDGGLRIAEISAAGSLSFEGKPAVILISRDTTDQRLSQEMLARAERMSALGALAAGVAHEINNPLAYVILNLELLRERTGEVIGAQIQDALSEAIDGAKRIHRIVNELRSFSGSDAPGPPEAVTVVKAVSSAVNIAQNEIRHRAQLERDHEPGLCVLGREGELVQVLVNLLVNAAQAIPENDGKQHVIAVRSAVRSAGRSAGRDDRVEITVSDTGTGVPPELLPHLFDPFVSGKSRGEGSGLGLAISKRIVDASGGELRIDSTVGLGTTVTLSLPRAPPPSTPPPPGPRAFGPIQLGGQRRRARVLIIDDEAAIVRALTRVLANHDVSAASDARDALSMLSDPANAYDAVLCDLMMPGLSGPELYREVGERRPELVSRFIFMTGGAFTAGGNQFVESLGERVLVKPFDPGQVVRRVEEIAGLTALPSPPRQ